MCQDGRDVILKQYVIIVGFATQSHTILTYLIEKIAKKTAAIIKIVSNKKEKSLLCSNMGKNMSRN